MSQPGITRRRFLEGSAVAVGAGVVGTGPREEPRAPAIRVGRVEPVVVSSHNGHPACVRTAYEAIVAGRPVVEAVVEGVRLVEDDPTDHTVGLGGLPNEDGVVELDASVMDGKSALAGAVASIRNIKNPASVALRVLRYSDHCLLVGEGALRFARAHGFKEENLLTDEAREIWLDWKAHLSGKDDWFPVEDGKLSPGAREYKRSTGTINCCGIDRNGDLAGTTTTSGLAFKIPGRVGDSPIIGAGLYVDNDYGAAGSTGRGEANIISCGSLSVVEALGRGEHPKDACLHAARRIVRLTRAKHLVDDSGRPDFQVNFYAIDKKGRRGGASLWAGGTYAVCDADGPRKEALEPLFPETKK